MEEYKLVRFLRLLFWWALAGVFLFLPRGPPEIAPGPSIAAEYGIRPSMRIAKHLHAGLCVSAVFTVLGDNATPKDFFF